VAHSGIFDGHLTVAALYERRRSQTAATALIHAAMWLGLSLTLSSAALAAGRDLRLADASQRSDWAMVRALLAQRADVNGTQTDGSTALHWAAKEHNLEIAESLLTAGANVNAATRFNITPLSLACANGDPAMIERFLKAGANPNSTSQDGQTALMTASLAGNADAVKVLLDHKASVNVKEPYKGQTALMWAAAEGNAAAASVLLEFGADIKARSKKGFSALLFAVREDHADVVKVLLRHGANVNEVGPDGTTALNMAVLNGYFGLASFLLDEGADPNAPDPRGSALHTLAWLRKPGSDGAQANGNVSKGIPPPTGNVTALELARSLLQHGADPNRRIDWRENRFSKEGGTARNPQGINLGRHFLSYVGATPFYIAAKNGDAPLMHVLAVGGADPKTPTKAGLTPLMVAAGLDYWQGESPGPLTGVSEAERLDAVKLALELGNDINAQANFGDYPMVGDPQYTLLYYPLNLEDLADKGVGDPRWSGSTALIGAIVSAHPSIVEFLIDHGARLDLKTKLGWTPLMVAEGVFFANAKKEFPEAAQILRKAMER
jgi:uncharacterized protein